MNTSSRVINWIAVPGGGRLAILACPRGGARLEDDLAGWREAGATAVLSLLTPSEIRWLKLAREKIICARVGVEFLSLPIVDRSVPADDAALQAIIAQCGAQLHAKGGLVIHCRAGIGRSAVVAAVLLRSSGVTAADAIAQLSAARGVSVPETEQQREWIHQLDAPVAFDLRLPRLHQLPP